MSQCQEFTNLDFSVFFFTVKVRGKHGLFTFEKSWTVFFFADRVFWNDFESGNLNSVSSTRPWLLFCKNHTVILPMYRCFQYSSFKYLTFQAPCILQCTVFWRIVIFVTVFYEYHFLRKLITSNRVFRHHVFNPHRVFCITPCFQTPCILPQSTGMMHIVDFFFASWIWKGSFD